MYIYIYIYIYIHIIYKKSHALTEMILFGFLYLQAFPWPWKLTFSRVSHRLFSNPLSLSKPMPPMENPPPPPHIHTHTHTHLKMNLPPPTEKRNPILKSEAPFQDMIPRKKNTKKWKLSLILEFQTYSLLLIVFQHWKKMIEILQKCDFLTWSI